MDGCLMPNNEVSIIWDEDLGFYEVKILTKKSRSSRQEISNFELILRLIKQIPASGRYWDKENRKWYVKKAYLKILTITFTQFSIVHTVRTEEDVIREQKEWQNLQSTDSTTDPIVDFFTALPKEISSTTSIEAIRKDRAILPKLFKRAVFILHPDRGGSNEALIKLNTSYDQLRKEQKC